jgi:predicted transcriptional regulator
MEDIKKAIIDILTEKGGLCISEIATYISRGKNTISKYLLILEAEGKVTSMIKTPYKYWKLK